MTGSRKLWASLGYQRAGKVPKRQRELAPGSMVQQMAFSAIVRSSGAQVAGQVERWGLPARTGGSERAASSHLIQPESS
jgi:hypothetical protein